MDFVLAQIALLLLPGIIWAKIDAKYGAGLRPDQTTLMLRAFLFGLATYAVLFSIYSLCSKDFGYSIADDEIKKIDLVQLIDEIALSVPLSFILSVIWLWSIRYRWLMKLLHRIGATRRYGDEDVWSFTLNSSQADVEYVHVRDVANGFIYAGWVNTFSENEPYRELLLRDAIVYDEAGTEISTAPHLYLSRPKGNIWIEFPYSGKAARNDN